jgi:hypothetical protein
MKCVKCFNPISEGRIRALPTAKTCVTCSDTARIGCHTVITGKNTYSEIQLVDQETSANLYRMQSRKGFGVATGVKFNFKK